MRSLMILALLATPAVALSQEPPPARPAEPRKAADADKKLADLESKLQALLKEIQSLRTEKKTADTVRARVIDKVVEKTGEKKETPYHILPSKDGDKLTLKLGTDG